MVSCHISSPTQSRRNGFSFKFLVVQEFTAARHRILGLRSLTSIKSHSLSNQVSRLNWTSWVSDELLHMLDHLVHCVFVLWAAFLFCVHGYETQAGYTLKKRKKRSRYCQYILTSMSVHESFVEGFVKSILRKDYVPPSVASLVSSLKEIHSINQTMC